MLFLFKGRAVEFFSMKNPDTRAVEVNFLSFFLSFFVPFISIRKIPEEGELLICVAWYRARFFFFFLSFSLSIPEFPYVVIQNTETSPRNDRTKSFYLNCNLTLASTSPFFLLFFSTSLFSFYLKYVKKPFIIIFSPSFFG